MFPIVGDSFRSKMRLFVKRVTVCRLVLFLTFTRSCVDDVVTEGHPY